MLLSNSAGPVINALQMVSEQAVSNRQGGRQTLTLLRVQRAAFISIPYVCSAVRSRQTRDLGAMQGGGQEEHLPRKGSEEFEAGLESCKESSSLPWLVTE